MNTRPLALLIKTAFALTVALILMAGFLAVWLLGPVSTLELKSSAAQSEIRFAAFGDQGTGNFRQWQVASALDRVASQRGLDFVALLGDNFYRHGVSGTDDWQWRYKFENMYRGKHLMAVPFFATLGNHDHYGNANAQIEYDLQDLGTGRWHMPARDYVQHFGITGAGTPLLRVLFLDTSPGARSLADTTLVLQQQLSDSEAAVWTVVASHAPIRSSRDFYDHQPLRQALLPVLTDHKVDLFISGHDHNLQVLDKPREPLHVIVGSGGKYGQGVAEGHDDNLIFAGFSLGFSFIEVSTDRLLLDIIDEHGQVLFTHERRHQPEQDP